MKTGIGALLLCASISVSQLGWSDEKTETESDKESSWAAEIKVPEPGNVALLFLGLGALIAARKIHS